MQNSETPTVIHFAGSSLDVGGLLSYIRSMAKHNGVHNVLVVQKGFKQTRLPFMKLLELPEGDYSSLVSPGACWDSFKQVFWLRRKLGRDSNLIFHAHSRGGVLIAIILVSLGYRNVVATIHHNGNHRWFYHLAHRALKRRMIFLCPAMKRYYGLEGRSWRDCIPGSVTPYLRRPGRTKPPFFGPQSERLLTLGGCGIVVEWKRWEIILEALGQIKPELRRRIRFVHVGDPLDEAISQDYAEKLRDKVQQYGLENQVEWRGHQDDLNEFFSEVDLLIHPAEAEPFGLAVLEALFAGVPAITSSSVGAADLFDSPANGLTFPTNDFKALGNLIEKLMAGSQTFPSVDRASLRPLEPEFLGARWAEVYSRLEGEPTG
ncbi:MAG: glycosyltransferase [Verrucomicrobiota bacterium]